MKKIKPTYHADDGSEHKTAEAAERRNTLREAQRAFQSAARTVTSALGRTATTADGKPFATGGWSTYWHVSRTWGGLPQLVQVDAWSYHSDIGEYSGEIVLMVNHRPADRDQKWTSYPIAELYVDKRLAEAAHLEACEQRLAELAKDLQRYREGYGAPL